MKIKSIHGTEPRRDGEYPDGAFVGYDGVTKIDELQENLGTYGITWFMIYKGDHIFKKMNAIHAASVVYFEEGAEL